MHHARSLAQGNYSNFLKTKAEDDIRMQRDYDKQQKEMARLQVCVCGQSGTRNSEWEP